MVSSTLSRSEFAERFSTTGESRAFQHIADYSALGSISHIERGLIIACWLEANNTYTPPALVIVNDEELDDFLAWSASFLGPVRPLTAFLRVVPLSTYQVFYHTRISLSPHSQTLFAGLIISEVMTHASGRGALDNLPLITFESTFSAVMARTLSKGLGLDGLEISARNWQLLHRLTDQGSKISLPSEVLDLWKIVYYVSQPRLSSSQLPRRLGSFLDGCMEVLQSGLIEDYTWNRLSKGVIPRSAFLEAMTASKERRVEAFEHITEKLLGTIDDAFSASYMVAYLASLVSGGSLEHSDLIAQHQSELPFGMLWYGIFASLSRESRVLSDNSFLGARILRLFDSGYHILSAPNCDIDIRELQVLMRGEPRSRSFRQMHSNLIRVEIAPTITTTVKWPPKHLPSGQLSLLPSDERNRAPDFGRAGELMQLLRKSVSITEQFLRESTPSADPKPTPGKTKRKKS